MRRAKKMIMMEERTYEIFILMDIEIELWEMDSVWWMTVVGPLVER